MLHSVSASLIAFDVGNILMLARAIVRTVLTTIATIALAVSLVSPAQAAPLPRQELSGTATLGEEGPAMSEGYVYIWKVGSSGAWIAFDWAPVDSAGAWETSQYPGTYAIQVIPTDDEFQSVFAGHTQDPAQATHFSIVDSPVTGISVAAAPRARVEGTVSLSGRGFASAGEVRVNNASGSTLTDEDGRYSLGGFTWGDSSITFTFVGEDNFRKLSTVVRTTDDTATLDVELEPAAEISGTVVDSSGEPLSDIEVIRNGVDVDVTDADGKFAIHSLSPGSYNVSFREPNGGDRGTQNWNENGWFFPESSPIVITGVASVSISKVMPRLSTVKATLSCALCGTATDLGSLLQRRDEGSNTWRPYNNQFVAGSAVSISGVVPGEYRFRSSARSNTLKAVTASFTVDEGVDPTTLPIEVRRERTVVRTSSGTLHEYDGGPSSKLGSRHQLGTGFASRTIISDPGDFDSDGRNDIISRSASGALELHRGTAAGTLSAPIVIRSNWPSSTRLFAANGDVTGDGNADLYGVDKAGTMWIYPGDGRGSLLDRVQLGSSGRWKNYSRFKSIGYGTQLVAQSGLGNVYTFDRTYEGFSKGKQWGYKPFKVADFFSPGDVNGDRVSDVAMRTSDGTVYVRSTSYYGGNSVLARGWDVYTAAL